MCPLAIRILFWRNIYLGLLPDGFIFCLQERPQTLRSAQSPLGKCPSPPSAHRSPQLPAPSSPRRSPQGPCHPSERHTDEAPAPDFIASLAEEVSFVQGLGTGPVQGPQPVLLVCVGSGSDFKLGLRGDSWRQSLAWGPWSGLGDSASEKWVTPGGAARGCGVSGREADSVGPPEPRGRGMPQAGSPSMGRGLALGAPPWLSPWDKAAAAGALGLRAHRGDVSSPRHSWWPGCPQTCSSCPGSRPCSDARPGRVRGQDNKGACLGEPSLNLRIAPGSLFLLSGSPTPPSGSLSPLPGPRPPPSGSLFPLSPPRQCNLCPFFL